MNANSLHMEQFEMARVRNLKDIYGAKVPMLWDIIQHLLNADGRPHKTQDPNPTMTDIVSATHTGNATGGTESLHPFEIVCRTIFPNTLTLIITFREGSLSYQF